MIAFIKEPREVWGIERPAVFYRSPPRRSKRTWPLRMIRTKHRIVPIRSGEQTIPRNDAQPALGIGFYLRRDLAGMCLCSIRHRYVRQQDRWLASLQITANTVCLGCSGASAV
jgi:hypothetical protein